VELNKLFGEWSGARSNRLALLRVRTYHSVDGLAMGPAHVIPANGIATSYPFHPWSCSFNLVNAMFTWTCRLSD